MATIIVFQHGDLEGPGRLGATLRDHGFRLDIRRPDRDGVGAVPPDLDNVHGVISLGGAMNVGDAAPWLAREMEFLAAAHERSLPVIGVCLGAQMLAAALGGKVEKMARPEWGLAPVSLTVPGQTETMLAGIPWEVHQFHAHGREVTELPPEAVLLASSAGCKVQAYRCGLRSFGFQYHFECDRPAIEGYARRDGEMLARAETSVEAVTRQLDGHYAMFARAGDRLCVNVAMYAFPFDRLVAV
jgi:GMP synthase-like glutamine amidotransferase